MGFWLQGQPGGPIIIQIQEPKSELQGLSDLLFGSLGLAGVLIIIAVLLAGLFAGVLFLWRMRSAGDLPEDEHPHIV
jgi:hypothetical protein